MERIQRKLSTGHIRQSVVLLRLPQTKQSFSNHKNMPSDQLILAAVFNRLSAISTFEMNIMRFFIAYTIDGDFFDAYDCFIENLDELVIKVQL